MKLRLRIALLTAILLTCCCVILYGLNLKSSKTMVEDIKYIELVDPNPNVKPLAKYDEAEDSHKERLVASLALVVILGSLASYYLSSIQLAPIKKLNKAIETLDLDDFQKLDLPSVKDESYDLISSYNQMIDRLNESFEREKRVSLSIAHEFRTPLSILLTKYELLELKGTSDLNEYQEVINLSKDKVEYLASITTKLLDLYRKTKTFNDTTFSLTNLVKEVSENFLVNDKKVILSLDLDEVSIKADNLLIRQVITNLISNSIKYNVDNGQVLISLKKKDQAILTIKDTGIGISEEDLALIFEPFYRADKSRNEAYGGSGLGLVLVKEVLDHYNVSIDVASSKNGTIFTIKW